MPEFEFEEGLQIGQTIGKKWRVVEKLGEGGCGSVFKVRDVKTDDGDDKKRGGEFYALKVEFNSANAGNVLKMEVQILSELKSKPHTAKCIGAGKKDRFSYMVMTLLGESLDSLVKKHGPFFNVSTQMRIGICVLFGVKQIHDVGYLHRDLKPANIALGSKGSPDERYLLVLDFGLARQYVQEDPVGKRMRPPRERALFRGTARYCSVAMHDRLDQGRCDDLWALVYILAELRADLAWHDVDDKTDIGEMKRRIADEALLARSPVEMLEFVRIVRDTRFYDRPDYETLFRIMDGVMKKGGFRWSDPYHWEKGRKVKRCEEKGKDKKAGRLFGSLKKKKNNKSSSSSSSSNSTETAVAAKSPFFTADDFRSNPIGF